jgi:hypothetical protein
MTAGLRSTELWLTILTNVGIVASALTGALTPKWAAVSAAVATAAYALARGLAKQGTTPPSAPPPPTPLNPGGRVG